MKKKITILMLLLLSIFLSYSIYFYLCKSQRTQQGQFRRNITNPPKELLRKDLDPAGAYYFAGKDQHTLWLGNEKNPVDLVSIAIDNGFEIALKTLPISEPFEKGQLAYVNYPFFVFINGRKRLIHAGVLDSPRIAHSDTTDLNFDIGSSAADSAFWLRVSTEDGFQLGYLKVGDTLKERNILTTRGLSALSRDGILAFDETSHSSAYVYFYRNSFLLLNKDYETVEVINTIDTVTFAQVDIGRPDLQGTRRKNTSALSLNYRADLSNGSMYIYSRARTASQADIDRDSIVFDIYSISDKKYKSSFLIAKKYDNESILDFRIIHPYIFLLVRTKVIILKF